MSGGKLAVLASFTVTLLFIFSCLHYAIAGAKPVSVSVYPSVIMAGGELRLRCRIAPHPDNRLLEYGIQNVASSQRDLDGDQSRLTWEAPYPHIPCDAGSAYCAIYRINAGWLESRQPFTIAGCD